MAFTWGAGGQISSPEQAARKRSVAEALMAQSATPGSNWAEGLSDVAAALSGTILDNRVTEAETAGRERAGALFADLAVNQDPNAIIAALTSPDAAWGSEAQTSIASALLNSGLERQDPMYQMNMQKAQLELEALRNPQLKAEPFTLSPGDTRYAGDGSVLAQGGEVLPDPKDAFAFEKDLASQYGSQDPVKQYEAVRNGYERVQSSAALGNGPGDISMIFAYMKMLDPTSVVREGEFASAENAGGVGEQVSNIYNKLLQGQRLTPELRDQFLKSADALYGSTAGNLTDLNTQFTDRSNAWGVDPNRFLRVPETYDRNAPVVADPAAPPAPPDVDPADWAMMTPEERALWQ